MARPREFDTDKALRAMMNLFWERGYEGTSMHMIEQATGLRKQSLYRAFGDKRGMYLAALTAYEHEEMNKTGAILARPGSAAARFGQLFRHVIDRAINDGDRRGCFLCNAGIDQAPLHAATGERVAEMVSQVEEIFAHALSDGGPGNSSPGTRSIARSLLAGYFGLRVLVTSGANQETLEDAASGFLSMIPSVSG
ncbi:MAG: TetR/AcrR family transcriptional regulator [Alphaproteobacteria bacterium]